MANAGMVCSTVVTRIASVVSGSRRHAQSSIPHCRARDQVALDFGQSRGASCIRRAATFGIGSVNILPNPGTTGAGR